MTDGLLHDRDIVCFGSEQWSYTGFQQHTMKLLSKHNRILWVNAIGTRRVEFSLRHVGSYLDKIVGMLKPARAAGDEAPVHLCTPRIVPLVYHPLAQAVNRLLLRRQLGRRIASLGLRDILLWVGTPTAAPYLDVIRPRLTIYNPVDRYHAFSFVDPVRIRALQARVAKRADLVLCTSDAIREDILPCNPNVHVIPHGVNYDHFASALRRDDVPDDLDGIPRPILGFFGGLHEWIDVEVLVRTARAYPQAHMVLIGWKGRDLGELERLPNVHLLGPRPFAAIPSYLKQFDVCLIPFLVNELMVAVDPTKLREYLAQGKPVVSTGLPEVRKLEDHVYIGDTVEAFVEQVGKALQEDDPERRAKRIALSRSSDWPARLRQMTERIERALAETSAREQA